MRHSVTSKSEEESGGLRVLTLTSWIPRLKKGKFYIEGDLKEVDTSMKEQRSFESSRYRTSIITRRISARVVATKNKERKKRLYVLEGFLVEENNNPWTPHFIMEKFKFGFPDNWEKIVEHWIRIEKHNSKNYVNMSRINSSIHSDLSNISANSSGFIHSRPANLSTTVNTQTNSGPEPDPTMRTDFRRSSNDAAAIGEVEAPAHIPHLDLPVGAGVGSSSVVAPSDQDTCTPTRPRGKAGKSDAAAMPPPPSPGPSPRRTPKRKSLDIPAILPGFVSSCLCRTTSHRCMKCNQRCCFFCRAEGEMEETVCKRCSPSHAPAAKKSRRRTTEDDK